jgi:hypothetical protein
VSYIKAYAVRGRPGYATVEIGYSLNTSVPALTIQKATPDGPYLGRNGTWQPSPDSFTPLGVESDGKRTLVQLGPEIVDRIAEDERIKVAIPAIGFSAELVWSDIPPSSRRVGSSVFAPRPQPVPDPPPPFETTPHIMTHPATDPNDDPTTASAGRPPAEVAAPHSGPTRTWLWLGALVLLLVILAGVAGWWNRGELRDFAAALLARSDPSSGPSVSTPLQPGSADDLQRLRAELKALIDRNGDLSLILTGGQKLLESNQPDLREEGFRAIDVAAARGLADAQLAMGKLHDPRYWREGGPLGRANAPIAAAYYAKAARAGDNAGRAELNGLCARLTRAIDGLDDDGRARTIAQYCN